MEVNVKNMLNCEKHMLKFSFFSNLSPPHIWCINSKRCLSYFKLQLVIYARPFMTSCLFYFQLSLSFWKCWTRRRNIIKIWISQNQKSILEEIKSIFHIFLRVSLGEKIAGIKLSETGNIMVNTILKKQCWFDHQQVLGH